MTRIAALLLAAALGAAACGGTTGDPRATASGEPEPTAIGPTPAASGTPAPTASPAVLPSDPAPTPDPVAPTLDPGASPGPAAGCSGSDANREFYAALAGAVAWPVLCAVLPRGWYVSAGSYRLANGGRLEIGYQGPAGARVTLTEGNFCTESSGCVPPGEDAGPADLGPLAGTLVRLDDGGFAVVVDRGLRPSWLLVARGLEEAAVVALAAAVVEVATGG